MVFGQVSTKRLLLIGIATLFTVCQALAENYDCQSGSSRLRKRVKPVHYDLKVTLSWVMRIQNEFQGRVAIDVEFDHEAAERDVFCNSDELPFACEKIILHAGKGLQIETVEFVSAGRTPAEVEFCRDHSNDQLILKLDEAFQSSGQILITYSGRFSTDRSKGFFQILELDGDGKKSFSYATSLEPGHARSVLPCFDEPDFKATFGVTVEHEKKYRALSNMHVVEETESDESVTTRFENTPKMSTYLLAIVIGRFDYLESKSPDSGITFRAYTPPGRAEEARESLNLIVESYENFAKFYNAKQPLKKIDFVTVNTADGSSMENWGLVTVAPKVLLNGVERRQDSYDLMTEHYVRTIIVHEMAHFWFGNMVTMKWWDDLWLNEGFASLMASAVINIVYPQFGGRHYGLLYEQSATLMQMAKPQFEHPIKQTQLQSMKDIEASFDFITYSKASIVLRMLSNFMGGDKFQLGIQNYIKKFMYKNAEADDLWRSLNEVGDGLDVGALMNSWIHNEGFPLIEATLDRSDNWLRLTQRKFPSKRPQQKGDPLWVIPISFVVSNGRDELTLSILMEKREIKVKLPSWFQAGQSGHYVKVNLEFTGLFRVMYDDEMLKLLKEPIANKILSPADRMNLLDDYQALFQRDLIKHDKLNELVSWFKNEQHEVVLMTLMSISDLYAANQKSKSANILSILKDYFHNKLESTVSAHRDYELRSQENLLQTMVRSRTIYTLACFNYEPALNYTLQYFRSKPNQVPPHMMKAIYSGVASAGTNEEYEKVKELISKLSGQTKQFMVLMVRSALDLNRNRFNNFVNNFRY